MRSSLIIASIILIFTGVYFLVKAQQTQKPKRETVEQIKQYEEEAHYLHDQMKIARNILSIKKCITLFEKLKSDYPESNVMYNAEIIYKECLDILDYGLDKYKQDQIELGCYYDSIFDENKKFIKELEEKEKLIRSERLEEINREFGYDF